jgi:Protein of unknown function (DUF3144)
MSEKTTDPQLDEAFGAFIDFANTQSNVIGNEKTSVAILHAAARYNAFSVWAVSQDKIDFLARKDAALANFSDMYKKLYAENLHEFETHFDGYNKNHTQ